MAPVEQLEGLAISCLHLEHQLRVLCLVRFRTDRKFDLDLRCVGGQRGFGGYRWPFGFGFRDARLGSRSMSSSGHDMGLGAGGE